jgi:hypothetical protein
MIFVSSIDEPKKEGKIVKGIRIALQSFAVFLGTVAVAVAEEAKKEGASGGYEATAYVWWALIVIILAYGVYDSFFRPID